MIKLPISVWTTTLHKQILPKRRQIFIFIIQGATSLRYCRRLPFMNSAHAMEKHHLPFTDTISKEGHYMGNKQCFWTATLAVSQCTMKDYEIWASWGPCSERTVLSLNCLSAQNENFFCDVTFYLEKMHYQNHNTLAQNGFWK